MIMNRSTEILAVSGSTTSVTVSEAQQYNPKSKPPRQQVVAVWNKQKSYSFIGLIICLIVWACVFFPLIE